MKRLYNGAPRGARILKTLARFTATAAPVFALLSPGSGLSASAQTATSASMNTGPYNVVVLEGGVGLERPLAADSPFGSPNAAWSISGWARADRLQPGAVIIVAVGETSGGGSGWRGIELQNGELVLALSPTSVLHSRENLNAGRWYAVAATYDGNTARLYLNGRPCGEIAAATARVNDRLQIAPVLAGSARGTVVHFGGSLAELALSPTALEAKTLESISANPPNFSLVTFDPLGVGWPLQEHAWRGLLEPQDPWTLPKAKSPPDAPSKAPVPRYSNGLLVKAPGLWALDSWQLRAAPDTAAAGAQLSQSDYDAHDWYAAVVPGTVLTTLIARGVYPDSDHGLNNLAIPDTLSRQDYWYRSVFLAPPSVRDRDMTLTFNGINYAAEVWLNGTKLGGIKGAFIRGTFNVTGLLRPGRNAVAVRISPPPHPGIPHEQSIAAGPGGNGGMLALDGPTFIASEGWDWIPGIRDRNTGIWQDVELRETGGLRLLDPQVVTHLPLPRIDNADIAITVPVENRRSAAVEATLIVRGDSIAIRKTLSLPPGLTTVTLDHAEFPQLHLASPRLWWPNGYGAANLYPLEIGIEEGDRRSDTARLKFGIREITYELSLFDHDGRLRRVELDPALGSQLGQRLADVRHQAIKRTPLGWAASLTAEGETSAAVHPVSDESLAPYLVIKVNGVRIAARGGSWGTDDSRKRISRAHLEPYFQLHRDAHLNIIRNWLGQNTEDVFYELADEYGLLVLNDFWESTQDYQLEAQDPALFLSNARDVISRYRNHPSIAVWFGRNEGVPQPIINEGLAQLTAALDGTRYYTGSSNSINLQVSGPYNYRPPEAYFTNLAGGFSVEVGTPSLSTLESLRASIPSADRWPLGDTYAYHDWHFGGNGDVASFMEALAEEYGAADSLEDFERKAQFMDYESYRAIFEGFAAHLWTRNSGRLLWMTHPSWPSNTWQIYSSDYDTAAAYYAVKKACEPLHAQLDLPDFRLAVVNTSQTDQPQLILQTRVLSLDNRLLIERSDRVDAGANSVSTVPVALDLKTTLAQRGVVLVKLTLLDAAGSVLSDNLYWQGEDEASHRRLNALPEQPLALRVQAHAAGSDRLIDVTLTNRGRTAALAAKITMLDAGGERVLPVYYSDNYVSLLPGEVRTIAVRCPASVTRCARVSLRGWNVQKGEIAVR